MSRPFKLHTGGPCPVKPDTRVDIRLRDGLKYFDVRAGGLDWHHFGPDYDDIVAWRESAPAKIDWWLLGIPFVVLGFVVLIAFFGGAK